MDKCYKIFHKRYKISLILGCRAPLGAIKHAEHAGLDFSVLKVNEKLELHACKSKAQTLKVICKPEKYMLSYLRRVIGPKKISMIIVD